MNKELFSQVWQVYRSVFYHKQEKFTGLLFLECMLLNQLSSCSCFKKHGDDMDFFQSSLVRVLGLLAVAFFVAGIIITNPFIYAVSVFSQGSFLIRVLVIFCVFAYFLCLYLSFSLVIFANLSLWSKIVGMLPSRKSK